MFRRKKLFLITAIGLLLFTISIPFASAQSNPNKYYNVNLEWYSDNWVNIAPAPNTSALARPSVRKGLQICMGLHYRWRHELKQS